ncbi:MAG: hypothetical protein NC187_08270 [Candidatus Amulumruptor caecigallinarius]|nr:hypothetical protein [Candidatus Amulumruptor caecigallinarius]MCM1397464.1 hypothetical protein [Candidatus Amulumruptor caecigallinarius]MCM1454329.1 hypothetical protein [bacterium]
MADIKITDLVDQATIDKIKELSAEMQNTLATYTTVAKELAKGIDVPVKGLDDLEKLQNLLAQKSKEAASATDKLNNVVSQQRQVIANTTTTISRQLMEQERVNKTQRQAYTEHAKVKQLLDQYHDTYENQVQSLVKVNAKLSDNSKAQKENEKALKQGSITAEQYMQEQTALIAEHRALTQEKHRLTQVMTAEEKAQQSAETSYVHMSQQLELLKKAYKDLSEEGRESDFGKELEQSIQNLDAHLKDTAADMGEFQRNIGNYAIAGQNGVVATESLMAVMEQEARTQQDLVDQTKILEEAKLMLNKEDENYRSTIDALNAKLEENKQKLTDVSDIIGKDATSVAEAEAQNKRLHEALKHVDLTSEGAQQKIKELNDKIERNTALIKENTPAIRDQTKETEKQQKANEGLASGLLNLVGINGQFGSSLKGLEDARTGDFIAGLNTQVKAFGQTLLGLLANPWVLAILGIAGVGTAVKWWFDYNKGLIEASRLTQNFTGLTGEAADKVTTDMQTMAEKMGKGFEETIGAANTLVQQFGMSWDEAARLIEDGIVAGADMSGKFVENIERFGPALRDCGVEADELVAILAETRNGIFNEDGVQAIVKASTRLRAMTKQTEESLEAVGISAKQMQKDLESGNITMIEAVQQVSAKLKELPENSQEAGQVIKNVFGRTAAEGGQLLLQSIADVNTCLDEQKEKLGELGKVNEAQMEAQKELNATLAAVFKMSGTSFEEMTTRAKTYVAQGLTAIIKGCVDIANWFVEMYNKSLYVRTGIAGIKANFMVLWDVVKGFFNLILSGFKSLGEVVDGFLSVLNGDFAEGMKKIKDGVVDGFKGLGKSVISTARDIGRDVGDAFADAANSRLDRVSFDLKGDTSTPEKSNTAPRTPAKPTGESEADKKAAAKAAKEAEKEAREELKRINELEEAKIAVMADGHEKELSLIRLKFKKKIDEIKGEGDTQLALRIQLAEQCEKEVAECELKYQQNLAKINLENRLATVKAGSKEELTLKLAQLEAQREAEIKEAEATGADVDLINEKFNARRQEMTEEYAAKAVDAITRQKAAEQEERDTAHISEMAALDAEYAEKLAAAKGNQEKIAEITAGYNREKAAKERQYAEESAQAAVASLEEVLQTEDMSAEDRLAAERALARAKAELEQQMAQDAIDAINEISEADDAANDGRLKKALKWLQVASEACNAINDLVAAVYDAKIEKIEEEQEVNEEAGEAEQERISELVDKKVITEEEGEARKRAAEAQTAKKNEELEKKKQQLQYKQALWDKANSIAQVGINTAMAIMTTAAQLGYPAAIPFIAVAGAMGALQLATILATPIPKYAKGTDYHKGGAAIVGDGGQSEVVMFNGGAWLTPDTPTLVDIPRGAVVIPSVNEYDHSTGMTMLRPIPDRQVVVSGYDDQNIRRGVSELAYLIRQNTKQQRAIAYRQEYELFKSRI